MQENQTSQDPFNFKYLLVALVVMLALPTVHAILGWFVYYL